MSHTLTKSGHIRQILEKDFDILAAHIQARLEVRGILVTPHLISDVKSKMRKEKREEQARKEKERQQYEAIKAQRERESAAAAERKEQERLRMEQEQDREREQARKNAAAKSFATRKANPKSLRQHVIEALAGRKEGMSINEIKEKVRVSYITTSEFLSQALYKKLRLMVLTGEIVKGPTGQYVLMKPPVQPKLAVPVQHTVQPLVQPSVQHTVVQPPIQHTVQPPIQPPIQPSVDNNSDMIDSRLLVEVNNLVKKIGGANRLRDYVATLEELRQEKIP